MVKQILLASKQPDMFQKSKLKIAIQELPEELHGFYLDLAKEAAKDFIRASNTFLNQTIAINAALLAGSIAMWDRLPFPIPVKATIVVLAIINTLICFCASIPLQSQMSVDEPELIRFQLEKIARKKLLRIRVAAAVTVVTMAAGAIGLTVFAFNS